MKMNNIEFIVKAAYEERIHRELHGVEQAKTYLKVLRKAASMMHVKDAFKDVTFDKHGLATGGPFEGIRPAMERANLIRSLS